MTDKQSIDWNIRAWNQNYTWPESGEEWSKAWGNSTNQWHMTIFPRIMSLLPAKNIIEIAPGWGRWTRFLLQYCSTYQGFDISEKAIDECRRRFCFDKNAKFFHNNGISLPGVKDNSIDFIFSMDSLVHAEIAAIEPYIEEFSRVLSDSGYGFIHHSNMNEHTEKTPNKHLRATSVSAEIFQSTCVKNNLICVTQEKVNWGQSETNDCFSVFTKENNITTKVRTNNKFHEEIDNAFAIHQLYNTNL